jgi:hypothetical protein
MPETPDAIIARLVVETIQSGKLIAEAKHAMSKDSRFQGLSLVGGVKAIIKTLWDTEEELRTLEAEYKKHLNDSFFKT